MSTVKRNWVTVKRGKAFRATKSQPEDWAYNRRCTYGVRSHCELCDTEILWQYGLQNYNTNQVMLVGSECIKWFYEAYIPNGLELAIQLMHDAYKKEHDRVVAGKIEKFVDKGYGWVVDYLIKSNRGYADGSLQCGAEDSDDRLYIPTSKFRASIKSKGYLNDKEIINFTRGYNRSRCGLRYQQSEERKVNGVRV